METFNQAILPEGTYQELEPLIKPLVHTINRLGVVTGESCQGHLYEEHSSCPYVLIYLYMSLSLSSEKLIELLWLVREWNVYQKKEKQWIFIPNSEDNEYSPPAILRLRPRESNSQRDSQVLHRFQKQASELASFLTKV